MIHNPLGFYLGIPEPSWIARTSVPVCVSYGRLRRLKGRYPRSPRNGSVMVDSRGFHELRDHGRWTITAREYFADVARFDDEIGNIGWVAAQDWMAEPPIIYGGKGFAGTRQFIDPNEVMSFDQLVFEHQRRTVDNFAQLTQMWTDLDLLGDNPFMPTLQGWTIDQYHRCWDMYEAAGIRISEHYPVVAVGSVCTRQNTAEITAILRSLRERDPGLPAHGFGVKQAGLLNGDWSSADSQAWSSNARWGTPARHPDCTAGHKNCASCLTYALGWREQLMAKVAAGAVFSPQMDLFELEEAS